MRSRSSSGSSGVPPSVPSGSPPCTSPRPFPVPSVPRFVPRVLPLRLRSCVPRRLPDVRPTSTSGRVRSVPVPASRPPPSVLAGTASPVPSRYPRPSPLVPASLPARPFPPRRVSFLPAPRVPSPSPTARLLLRRDVAACSPRYRPSVLRHPRARPLGVFRRPLPVRRRADDGCPASSFVPPDPPSALCPPPSVTPGSPPRAGVCPVRPVHPSLRVPAAGVCQPPRCAAPSLRRRAPCLPVRVAPLPWGVVRASFRPPPCAGPSFRYRRSPATSSARGSRPSASGRAAVRRGGACCRTSGPLPRSGSATRRPARPVPGCPRFGSCRGTTARAPG